MTSLLQYIPLECNAGSRETLGPSEIPSRWHTTNVVWRPAHFLLDYANPSFARRSAVMKFVQIWEGNQCFVVPGAEDTRDDS